MKNLTNARNCLTIVLIMEAIKEAPEKICYDDIHNFLARHPEYQRICEVTIELDDPMTSAEEKVYTRLLSSRCFRRDALLFLGYLENRYSNEEERVIDPTVHFNKHFIHIHPETSLKASDVKHLSTLLRNPNSRMLRQIEHFFKFFYVLNTCPSSNWAEAVLETLANCHGDIVFRSLPYIASKPQLDQLLDFTRENMYHREDLIGKILSYIRVGDPFINSITRRFCAPCPDRELFQWLPHILNGPNQLSIQACWAKHFNDHFQNAEFLIPFAAVKIENWKKSGQRFGVEIEKLFMSEIPVHNALGMSALAILLDKHSLELKEDTVRLERVISKVLEILRTDSDAHPAAAFLAEELIYNFLLDATRLDDDRIFLQTCKKLLTSKVEEELLTLIPFRDRSPKLDHTFKKELISRYKKIFQKTTRYCEWYSNYGEIAFAMLCSLDYWPDEKARRDAFASLLTYAGQYRDDLDNVDLLRIEKLVVQMFEVTSNKTYLCMDHVNIADAKEVKSLIQSEMPLTFHSEHEALESILSATFFSHIFEAEEICQILRTALPYPSDPYFIFLTFMQLCRHGMASEALSFFRQHEATLVRPVSLPVPDAEEDEDMYGTLRAWACIRPYLTRLNLGIMVATYNGHSDLVEHFNSEDEIARYINTEVDLTCAERFLCISLERDQWFNLGAEDLIYDSNFTHLFDGSIFYVDVE